MNIIEDAAKAGRSTLTEFESKQVLESYGIPVTREMLVNNEDDLAAAANEVGYPIVLKGCSPDISHKTEMDMVRTNIKEFGEAKTVFATMMKEIDDTNGGVLVQEMVEGKRELVVGMTRDPQFGPCVMFGLGGIFTEVLEDVSFRVAPLEKLDAMDMMREIKGHKILNAIRGMEAANVEMLSTILMEVGRIGLENEAVKEIDINPVILKGADPVAVDALIVLS